MNLIIDAVMDGLTDCPNIYTFHFYKRLRKTTL